MIWGNKPTFWRITKRASRSATVFRGARKRVALILINDSVKDAAVVLFGKETGHIEGRRVNFDASDLDFAFLGVRQIVAPTGLLGSGCSKLHSTSALN
jgi:hypothetical protein